MSDDLAEFLRRAAQRYGARSEILDAEVVEDAEILDPGDDVAQDVARHVARRMGKSDFTQRVATLGEQVGQSDDRMEAHLHSAFEHDLGQFGTRTSTPEASVFDSDSGRAASATEAAAASGGLSLRSMLRDERQLRNAIILSEILRRPEHLW